MYNAPYSFQIFLSAMSYKHLTTFETLDSHITHFSNYLVHGYTKIKPKLQRTKSMSEWTT